MTARSGRVAFTDVRLYEPSGVEGMSAPTDLLVDDGVIAAIGPEARARIDAQTALVDGGSRHLLVPGLINAHFHSPANHLKGSLPSLPLELFMLYESPADPELEPGPREAYLRTMLGALEMIRTGTTSVQDDAFLMPYPTPDIIDAVMQAYADSGIRASVALDQPSLPESHKLPYLGSFDPETRRALDDPAPLPEGELLAAYDHLLSRWHGAAGGRLTAAVSVSAPQRVSPDYFAALDELSRVHDIPLFVHMLETKVQRALRTEQPRFAGRSLVGYTAELGLLSRRTNVIHAVWVDDADLGLIADAGATIAHNPVSNLRLGSGVAPFRRMRELGIPVALGVDEAICDDTVNMWGVVKMAGLIHNIEGRAPEEWPQAREVLDSLWSGGASAMLRDDLGAVEVGKRADLALLDLHSPAFTPLNDVRGQLVYCESGASVRLTMVEGVVVFEDGDVRTVDERALLDEARELFARKRPAVERARAAAEPLRPQYARMVDTARTAELGMNRWIGTP